MVFLFPWFLKGLWMHCVREVCFLIVLAPWECWEEKERAENEREILHYRYLCRCIYQLF